MNFVPCVAWVARGVAANNPEKLQLSPEELKRLVNEARGLVSESIEEEDDSDINDDEKEESIENEGEVTEEIDSGEEEDDFDARYNLDSYDNNDDDNPLFTINDIAVHVDNHDDEYVTDQESEGDLEEKEDFAIKDSDNLLLVGHVEESSSVLEIHIYNQEEDSFYVHHDIVLPAYPLAIEWLDFHPSDEKPGNYAAIGDMTPVIKIWDLDVVDVLEPDYELGINPKKKKSKKLKNEDAKYHSDAVLSLGWNKLVKNLLASGSADSSVIIWDLEDGTGLNQLTFHSNKVQTLQWHPTESPILLSGCTDGFVKLYDCRTEGESKSWKVEGEIERVLWNIEDSFKFFFSTDQGYVYSVDMRKDEIGHSFQAHKEAVTGLDISPLKPEILVSASMDRTLKVWDINTFQMMKSMKLKVGSIFTAKTAPDLDLTVAVGGNYSSNSLKVINILGEQKKSVEPELDEADQNEENNLNRIKKNYGSDSNQWSKFPNSGFQQSGENYLNRKKKKNYGSGDYQGSSYHNAGIQQREDNLNRMKKSKGSYKSQELNFPSSGFQQSEENILHKRKKKKNYGSNDNQESHVLYSDNQLSEGLNRKKKNKNFDSNSQQTNFSTIETPQSEENSLKKAKKNKNHNSNSQQSIFSTTEIHQSDENSSKKAKKNKNHNSNSQEANFSTTEIPQSEENSSKKAKKNKNHYSNSQQTNLSTTEIHQSDENSSKKAKKNKNHYSNSQETNFSTTEIHQSEENSSKKAKKNENHMTGSNLSQEVNLPSADLQQSEENNLLRKKKKKNYVSNDSLSSGVHQSEENILKRIKKKKKQSSDDMEESDFFHIGDSQALLNIAKSYKSPSNFSSSSNQESEENNLKRIKKKKKQRSDDMEESDFPHTGVSQALFNIAKSYKSP